MSKPAPAPRTYHHGAAGVIAREVVDDGKSAGWCAYTDADAKVAAEVEARLAEVNIGYVDDMRGTWAMRKGGSSFFGKAPTECPDAGPSRPPSGVAGSTCQEDPMPTHGDGGALSGCHLKRDANDRLTMVTAPSPWPEAPKDLTGPQSRLLARLRANKGGGLYLHGAEVGVARRLEGLRLVTLEDNGHMQEPGGQVDGEQWWAEAVQAKTAEDTRARDARLVAELEARHPQYNGWTWEFFYPGCFSYWKDDLRVFFTPDWSGKGSVDVQITVNDEPMKDEQLPPESSLPTLIKYPLPLTSEFLFGVAKGFMNHFNQNPPRREAAR